MNENAEHLEIVRALAGGKAEAAAAAMSRHIDQAATVVVEDLFTKREIRDDMSETFLTPTPTPGPTDPAIAS
jgi:hypothetical protein